MSLHREAPPPAAPGEEVLDDARSGSSGSPSYGSTSLDTLEPTPFADAGRRRGEGGILQETGRILRLEGETIVVRPEGDENAEIRARRAVSCLVEPELHDLVLVATPAQASSGSAFVLAVLDRKRPDAALSVRGDLDLRLRDGRFRVAAQKGIDLVSPEGIDLVAGRVAVHANSAKIVAGEMVALASQVIAELTNVQLEGAVLDKVFERVSEHVQRSIRNVDEIDQLKAGQIDYSAEQSMTLRSDNTLVTAKDIVTLDGEPVHFG